jgi:alpha-glucosidase
MYTRSGGADPGRDGCRVPLPWSADLTGPSWLPQPPSWAALSGAAQQDDPGSMLTLYRAALAGRRALAGPMTWLEAPADVLAFARPGGFVCVINLSAAAVPLPPHEQVLLSSGSLAEGQLPPDTAVWLRTIDSPA